MVNYDKNMSANVNYEDKSEFFHALGVHPIENPKKYLDLPSIVGRNKRMAFRGLKEKCLSRLNS